jgi:sorting nexin-1/2
VYLDALENQLKALLKAMDSMVAQRKAMAEAAGDFSASLHALSTVELSPTLSGPLDALSELQITIRDVYDRQAQQDVLTFGIILEEYIRLIGSVKQAFTQRQKAFYSWHTAESELQKRKATHDKLLRQGKSQQDRLNQVGAEVGDAERKVHQARLLFEDMGRLMRSELDRFEREKVEDFKSGVETFLESAVEAQKEVRLAAKLSKESIAYMDDSLSRNGRHSSCNSTPRTTRRPSTGRPSCKPTSLREIRW